MLLSYYDNKKPGSIILFIHGTASGKDIWENQFNFLNKANYRIIGIDLRGHGNSKNPGGTCTSEDHINDLKETIDYLNINEQIIIVGHSFGAVLAARFAEKYPSFIHKLLLVSLPPRIPNMLIKYYKWFLGKPIELLKLTVNWALKLPLKTKYKLAIISDLSIIREILKDSTNWDFLTKVPKLSCPVYLSVGRFDYLALNSLVGRLHNKLPNSTLKIFNWASHTCMDDTPDEFNKWLLSVVEN